MNFPPSPEDMKRMHARLDEAMAAGRELHNRAMSLGYNHAAGIDGKITDISAGLRAILQPGNTRPEFHVWRIDQPSDKAEIFGTVKEVNDYLDRVATLPRYGLVLENNPRLVISTAEHGNLTVISDKRSGESFSVRTDDLRGVTRLCVHAQSRPTIGDWQNA